MLNPEQLEAVRHGPGPAVVIAGPGSGKTRVLTERIARLVAEGVPPETIAAVTFTRRAAGEMRARLEARLGREAADLLWIGTFHALSVEVLRRFGAAAGLPERWWVLDEEAQLRVVRRLLEGTRWAEQVPERVLRWVQRYRAGQREGVPGFTKYLAQRYAQAKQRLRALDYDDLVVEACRAVERVPEAAAWARRRAAWLLVDEYQDTSPDQEAFLRRLAPGEAPNLFVVGDPDQTIYGWRGASAKRILEFPRVYPGARVYRLARNHRSQARIVEVANASIRHNREHKPQPLEAVRPAGPEVETVETPSLPAGARFVAERAAQLVAEGVPPEEIAVLVRLNAEVPLLEQAVRDAGLPYTVLGGPGFFERPAVRAARALMDLVAGSRGAGALEAVLAAAGALEAWPALEALEDPVGRLERVGAPEGVPEPARGVLEGVRRCLALRGALEGARGPRIAEAWRGLKCAALEAGMFPAWKTPEGEAALLQLLDLLAEWGEAHPRLGIAAWLEGVHAAPDPEEKAEGVRVGTVHAAKGLEWRVVFLAGLAEGGFPVLGRAAEIEEERRLFYVGVTRAAERLYLVTAPKPSRFVAEVVGLTRRAPYDPRVGYVADAASREVYQTLLGI